MLCFLKNLFIKQPPLPCFDNKAENKIVEHQKPCLQTPKQASEYDVYIYCPDKNKRFTSLKWRKVGATDNAKHAVMQARSLHRKQEYDRIEIKKRSYSRGKDCRKIFRNRWR